MRFLLLLSFSSLAVAADSLDAFGHKWSVPLRADWKVEKQDGSEVLTMLKARPQEKPRRPSQFALAETPPFHKVAVEADVRRLGSSLIFVYAYTDDAHFNYAHLSVDAPQKQPVHNGIFHVYGGDRVRISPAAGPGALPSNEEWYRVKLTYDAGTGTVAVTVNGTPIPSLRGVDLSLGAGKVGIGSFFETAQFRSVKVTGVAAK